MEAVAGGCLHRPRAEDNRQPPMHVRESHRLAPWSSEGERCPEARRGRPRAQHAEGWLCGMDDSRDPWNPQPLSAMGRRSGMAVRESRHGATAQRETQGREEADEADQGIDAM